MNSLKRGMQTATETIGKARVIAKANRAGALQVAGLAVFAAGGFALGLWLGLFLAGAFLCLIGWAVDE